MLLPSFTLHRPGSLAGALGLLAEYEDEAAVYAGGTELLLLMKLGMAAPAHLVDIKGIADLDTLRVADGRLLIGAGVTHRRLERDPLVRRVLPAYARLSAAVANVRVRNAGSLGGNLCFAEPHSDPATLLTALDARVELASVAGRRALPIERFIVGTLETALAPGEIMTRVVADLPPDGTRIGYQRLALRERPTVNVAVVSGPSGVRVAVGAAGGRPVRARRAEEILGADPGAITEAADAASEAPDAKDDNEASAEYKRHLVHVLFRRAVAQTRR